MTGDRAPLEPTPRDLQRWQKAQQDLLKGRAEAALITYHDLSKKYPDSPDLWFELGLAAAKELDFDLADRAFQRTAELSPGNVSMRILLGQQYHLLRRMDQARTCFEQAAAMDPASVPAQLSLADWYERERRLPDAWACIEACAARNPQNAQVRCFRALLLHRQGKSTEAEKVLRELIQAPADPNVQYASRHQLAVLLDDLGQPAEAMRWLLEAKTALRSTANVTRMEQLYDQADRRRRSLLATLTPETIRRWRTETSRQPFPTRLAFLGGHPRSGTTLLEQILGAHPEITAFDEPMAFTQEILDPLAPLEGGPTLTLSTLNQLNEVRRSRFQQRYLQNLQRENADRSATGLLLDKNPSHTASIHLWLRLFPAVKIIIALRDPRDVIISCFFQNLQLNVTNANFLSLERTAKHYADLMDVWLRLRELGGFDWIESRYEDIVSAMESEGQRVTQFLGLAWHPQQAAYHEAARKKFVFAPTYNEVTRPVHQRAVNRWRQYASTLAPLQSRLEPYRRAFGYE